MNDWSKCMNTRKKKMNLTPLKISNNIRSSKNS